jgi:hypothetical protein
MAEKPLDKMHRIILARHYNYRTEQMYLGWTRRLILYHGKPGMFVSHSVSGRALVHTWAVGVPFCSAGVLFCLHTWGVGVLFCFCSVSVLFLFLRKASRIGPICTRFWVAPGHRRCGAGVALNVMSLSALSGLTYRRRQRLVLICQDRCNCPCGELRYALWAVSETRIHLILHGVYS